MKLKRISLAAIALFSLGIFFEPVSSTKLSHVKDCGGHNWDFFDAELKSLSSFFRQDTSKSFDEAKLVKVDHQGKSVTFYYDNGDDLIDVVNFMIEGEGSISLQGWKSIPRQYFKFDEEKCEK